jgi:hypothetical protein
VWAVPKDVSDKQRIAELFAASADLEELYFGPEDDVAPGSVQQVIRINSSGEEDLAHEVGLQKRGWQAPLQCPRRKHHRRELLEEVVLPSPLHCPSRQFPRVAENSAR